VRDGGPAAAAVAPLYRGGVAAVAHGAMTLPPWATALGFLPLCPTAAGIWPKGSRPLAPPLMPCPTAVGTPDAVGFDARCIFLEIFGSTIYFPKIKEKI
jgi:hypothetical protein